MALIGEMKYLTIGENTYSIPEPDLPIASSSTLGGIKVGPGLTIDSSTGVLTATGTSITIDTVMSDSSTNTVQNKVIKSYVDTNIPTKVSDLQNDSGFTTNTGTVTSVRVQASSPLSSSTSTAQSTSLNTTISFSNQNKNLVLAGPSSGSSAAPSFRSLVADDIPDLSSIYLTSFTEADPVFSASAAAGITATDITNWDNKVSDDHKWNDVALTKSSSAGYSGYVPFLNTTDATTASLREMSDSPSSGRIAVYNSSNYLISTTPGASDSSTKVATTAWVTGKGYLTSYTETDPTVPSWAKEESKPSYALNEITSADDIQAIEALTGTIGLLKKTAANTWTLDTTAYTTNTGTVTSVGAQNATNGGLTISGSPITTSGTITIGHSNVLTSAQTTQALYPIKIDKNGHISSYGTAVTSLPASDVYSWAKASTKPSYTASEVGAVAKTGDTMTGQLTASGGISTTTLTTSGNTTVGGNLTVDGDIKENNRIASNRLSTTGWYRVCWLKGGSQYSPIGALGALIRFNIVVYGNDGNNGNHQIDYISTYGTGNRKFVNEQSNGVDTKVDKIRCMRNENDFYIDIHFNSSAATDVYVFWDFFTSLAFLDSLTTENLTAVANAPSGETSLAGYSFASDGVFFGDLFTNGVLMLPFLTVGDAITSNADLHNYKTAGVYYATSAVASTLSNSNITTVPFKLIVMPDDSSGVWQIELAAYSNCIIAIQYYNGSTWGGWKRLTPA